MTVQTSAPLRLVLPPPPAANRYWRSITIRGQARVVLSREARVYREQVKLLLSGRKPIVGPIAVTLHWFRERRSGDLDGRIKVLLDALQEGAIENDSQVVELHAYRAEDPARPRVEVAIEVVGHTQLGEAS